MSYKTSCGVVNTNSGPVNKKFEEDLCTLKNKHLSPLVNSGSTTHLMVDFEPITSPLSFSSSLENEFVEKIKGDHT